MGTFTSDVLVKEHHQQEKVKEINNKIRSQDVQQGIIHMGSKKYIYFHIIHLKLMEEYL